jgi:thioredoxin-dependent peroxiredoxin
VTAFRAHTGKMAPVPRVGDPAPDFSLPGWYNGEAAEYTLSAEAGHPVVLAFYPRDGAAVCTRQLTAYSDELGALTATGAHVWGISPQDLDSKAAFAGTYGLKLPLLADTDLAVARRYGVDDGGRVRRAVVVVDATGTVAWMHVSVGGLRYRGPVELAAVLESL